MLTSLTGGEGTGDGEDGVEDTTPSTGERSRRPPTTSTALADDDGPAGGATDGREPGPVFSCSATATPAPSGPYLSALLDETGVVETTVDYKVSSGLSRPDFFDWPAHIQSTVPTAAPDIIVVTFGGNDAQDIRDRGGDIVEGGPTGNEEAWSAEYVRRANEVLDLLQAEGRTVIWVGIPNDDNPEVTARMQVQDEAARAAVAAHPDVAFVDTWVRFSGRSGGWAEYVIDPRDGEGKDVRADDGFHLNETGAEILALDIARLVEADLRARGATF